MRDWKGNAPFAGVRRPGRRTSTRNREVLTRESGKVQYLPLRRVRGDHAFVRIAVPFHELQARTKHFQMRVFFPEQSLHGIQLVFGTSARVCVVGCVSVGTIVSIAKPNFRVSVTVHRGCGRGVDTHVTRNSTLFVRNECASLPLNLRHAPQAGDQLQGRSFRGRGRRVWRVGFVGCPTPRRDRRQPAPRLRRRLSLLGLPAKRVDLPGGVGRGNAVWEGLGS